MSAHLDHFGLTVASMQETDKMIKRALVSDIPTIIIDVLRWFAPSTIKMKILLQQVWESGIGWYDLLPPMYKSWLRWNSELHLLTKRHIPHYYYAKCAEIDSVQLHGFCDASEDACAGVVYIHGQDKYGNVYISVTSKTKVVLLKRLTITSPRVVWCQTTVSTTSPHLISTGHTNWKCICSDR